MSLGRKLGVRISGLEAILAGIGIVGALALATSLRPMEFSGLVLCSSLQIVSALLALTYAASAFLRFRGLEDRLSVFLALGFTVIGLLEMSAFFSLYAQIAGSDTPARIPEAWNAARILLAALLLAGLIVERRRSRAERTVFDRTLVMALWVNAACQLVATQSIWLSGGEFTLAQLLKALSYSLLLGGTLLDNARLFEHTKELAARDCLTGLGNYRMLLNALEIEIQRSRRTGRPFGLLLMDLDGLKQVNDRHGHLVGTRALCRLGDVLRLHCRAMDTAARYGGDEFALVLPEADHAAAQLVGTRVSERLATDGESPVITVSFGAALFPADGQTAEALLESADRALYRMKRHDSPVLALARVAACL